MSGRYYLACSCGVQHVVESRQAGETIACSCGARLEVPTLVGLRKLPPVKEEDFSSPQGPFPTARPRWSAMQAFVFTTGFLLAVAGGIFTAYAAYRWQGITNIEKPVFEEKDFEHDLDKETPERLFDAWLFVSAGLKDRGRKADWLVRREEAGAWKLATFGGVAATLACGVAMIASFFLRGKDSDS